MQNYVAQGIIFIILFIIGSGLLLLFILTLNQFVTKSSNYFGNTVIYNSDIYDPVARNILNTITLEDPLYCNISKCKSVICTFIQAPLDSGEVASHFINNTFKIQCSKSLKLEYLIFQNCNFLNNILKPGWLNSNLPIEALTLTSCQLEVIHDEAFSLPIYTNLKCLSLTNNYISTLRKAIFKTIVDLESFKIHDNNINFVESNLLENYAGCLEILELDNSIKNPDVLRNITGRSPLLNIEILSIQGNSLPVLSSDLLEGVPNVKSLYIDKSEIEKVMIDAFQPMAKSIEQLFIRSNNIKTFESGVLRTILNYKSNFRLNIDDNPWHCDCSMEWMQDLMQKYPSIVVNDPICQTPKINAGIPFTEVDFCNGSGTFSSTSTVTTTTTTEKDSTDSPFEKLNITCDRLLQWLDRENSYQSLLNVEYQFPKHKNFVVKELGNGRFLVNITYKKSTFTLIWFPNEELMFNNDNIESNIKCVTNVRDSIVLKQLKPATSYTICLLEAEEIRPSPLNCLALITSQEYQHRAWLFNGDKPLVISMIILVLVFLSLTSAIVSYIIIRRYPTLLRGSKRVLIVRRRAVKVVVFPEGVHIEPCENTGINDEPNTLEDHDYLTPLGFSQRVRKDSQRSGESSRSSEASYISGIEPNLIQLATWRIHRLRNSNFQDVEITPPLPPNHPVDIPSLSYVVDIKENASLEE